MVSSFVLAHELKLSYNPFWELEHLKRSLRFSYCTVAQERSQMNNSRPCRDPKEILDDLVAAYVYYDAARDDEWEFQEEHPDPAFWSGDDQKDHDDILAHIAAARARIAALAKEAGHDIM